MHFFYINDFYLPLSRRDLRWYEELYLIFIHSHAVGAIFDLFFFSHFFHTFAASLIYWAPRSHQRFVRNLK